MHWWTGMRIGSLHSPQKANMRRACALKLCRVVCMLEHAFGMAPMGLGSAVCAALLNVSCGVRCCTQHDAALKSLQAASARLGDVLVLPPSASLKCDVRKYINAEAQSRQPLPAGFIGGP